MSSVFHIITIIKNLPRPQDSYIFWQNPKVFRDYLEYKSWCSNLIKSLSSSRIKYGTGEILLNCWLSSVGVYWNHKEFHQYWSWFHSDLTAVGYSLDTGILKNLTDDLNTQQNLRAIVLEIPLTWCYSKWAFSCVFDPRQDQTWGAVGILKLF